MATTPALQSATAYDLLCEIKAALSQSTGCGVVGYLYPNGPSLTVNQLEEFRRLKDEIITRWEVRIELAKGATDGSHSE